MAGTVGLEPTTSRFEVWRSIQLIVRAGTVDMRGQSHFVKCIIPFRNAPESCRKVSLAALTFSATSGLAEPTYVNAN
jgi:hypothetical protein